MDLTGKVVLLTGASRGLGRAMALGLSSAGASLALAARPGSEAKMAGVIETIARSGTKGGAIQLFGDIRDPAVCASWVARTCERFGTVHVLINNAAVGMDQVGPHISKIIPFYDVPMDIWHRIVETNINGTYHMTVAAIPALLSRKWGRIVNLSTGTRTMARAGFSPYGPSKAAVEAMTAIWAQDLAGTGVTVNALLPGGAADTEMVTNEDFPDRSRLVPPSAMIPPAVWLASDDSSGVSGMRIVAKDWDAALPPAQAFKNASAKAAW